MARGDDDDERPDAFFSAEFGKGDLADRLWRGGLRASPDGYTMTKAAHVLSACVSNGLEFDEREKATALVDAIETLWNDVARMKRACGPLSGSSHLDQLTTSTLVRLLLCIEPLQPPLITCIVNKISEFGDDVDKNGGLAVLLLSQLKWLDFIADSPALCENLLSIIQIVSPQMQRNIVESLPEILDDRVRNKAVKQLISILSENPSIMGSVVDALGALGVDRDSIQEVNGAVLSTLSAAHRDILPSSLRYLLRTSPPTLYDATVDHIRRALAQPGLGLAAGRLSLDALCSGLRMNKNIADHFIKTLRRLNSASDHRPADFWIILALAGSPAHSKPAGTLFRKKAAASMFTQTTLDAALAPFADSFSDLHGRLISIAASTIKAQEPTARKTGIFLYAMIFRLFNTGNSRRNVLNILLEHTGSRRPTEVDAALEALVLIAEESEESRGLLPHSALLQGLLDFIETFTDNQVRQIWALLALLCRSSLSKNAKDAAAKVNSLAKNANDEDEEDDAEFFEDGNQSELATLEILLRKELTHVDMLYRRIGVIGAATMIKIVGSHMRTNVFKMLFEAGRSQAFTQALAFDELGNILPKGDPVSMDSTEKIATKISEYFEENFIADAKADEEFADGMPESMIWANCDGEDGDVCVPIYRLINEQCGTLKGPRDAVRPMAPALRLLCILIEMRDKGDLGEVDAVIGAGISMPAIEEPSEFLTLNVQAKKAVLLSFFAAHGWVVELINCFSNQPSEDLQANCLRRLEGLIYLEDMLNRLTGRFKSWPDVLFHAYQAYECIQDEEKSSPKSGRGRRSSTGKSSDSDGSNSAWLKYARKLEPRALSLLRVTKPVKFSCSESDPPSSGGDPTGMMELKGKSLHYLLTQLLQIILQNVQQDLAKATAKGNLLSAAVLQRGVSLKKAAESNRGASISDTISIVQELKPALISLAKQLSRSLRRGIPSGDNDDEGGADDIKTIQLFKESAILCLKCFTGVLRMSSMKDVMAREFLFDLLATVRFDSSPLNTASDPLCDEDIQLAAKNAFVHLRSKLLEVSGDIDEMGVIKKDDDELRDDIGCSNSFGVDGHVAFLAALETLLGFVGEGQKEALETQISDAAGSFLERNWGDASSLKSKKSTKKYIPGIVRLYIQCAAEPFELLTELRVRLTEFSIRKEALMKKSLDTQEVEEARTDAEMGNDTLESKGWGSLTLGTFDVYCNSVYEQYVKLFQAFKPASLENTEAAFGKLHEYIHGLVPLYDLAKKDDKVLAPAMRSGRLIVDQFMKCAIPFLKDKFGTYRQMTLRTLKLHSKSTRLLQAFCSHSKSIRNTTLTGLVPQLRKTLESLLYRVQGLMRSQNEEGAYSLGNLKHRNISGEIVSSQEQYRSESEGSSSEYDSDVDVDQALEELVEVKKTKTKRKTQSNANSNSDSIQAITPPRKKQKQKSKTSPSFSTATERPDTTISESRPESRNRKSTQKKKRTPTKATPRRKSAMGASGTTVTSVDSDDDEDDVLMHSLLPPQPNQADNDADDEEEEEEEEEEEDEEEEEEEAPPPKKKRRKSAPRSLARKSKFVDNEAEAEDDDGEDDEEEGEGNFSGFLVEESGEESEEV